MMTEYVQQITCRREFVKKQSKLGNQKKFKCTYDVYNFCIYTIFFIILKKLTYFLKFSLHRVFFRLFLLVCVFLRSYFLTRRTPYSGPVKRKQFHNNNKQNSSHSGQKSAQLCCLQIGTCQFFCGERGSWFCKQIKVAYEELHRKKGVGKMEGAEMHRLVRRKTCDIGTMC